MNKAKHVSLFSFIRPDDFGMEEIKEVYFKIGTDIRECLLWLLNAEP
jgi:hypothetical protein